MRTTTWTAAATCLVALAESVALGQYESHLLPGEIAPGMLPLWVQHDPIYHERELHAPLAHEKAEPTRTYTDDERRVWADEGDPDATSVERLCKKPRTVLERARSGEWKVATERARDVFAQPPERYRDFTWDMVGNAAARAHVQLGDLAGAAQAHGAAARAIEDPDVAGYHRTAAGVLTAWKGAAADLRDVGTWQQALRDAVQRHVEECRTLCDQARIAKGRHASRERLLARAYDSMRKVWAVDASLGRELAGSAFRPAADNLPTGLSEMITAIEAAREGMLRVEAAYAKRPFSKHAGNLWNKAVKIMWNRVVEVKHVCRVHDYLARVGLATGGRTDPYFRQAHEKLFAPEAPGKVYVLTGGGKPGVYRHMEKRVEWKRTEIHPLD